jgi:hypothetical protein
MPGADFLRLAIPGRPSASPAGSSTVGLSFIVGDSEACKSWFMVMQALCVSAGLPLLGQFPVLQAPSLVISEENGQAEDQRRLHLVSRGLELDLDRVPIHMASDTSFSFDEPAKYAALRAYIDAHGIRLGSSTAFRVHRREKATPAR